MPMQKRIRNRVQRQNQCPNPLLRMESTQINVIMRLSRCVEDASKNRTSATKLSSLAIAVNENRQILMPSTETALEHPNPPLEISYPTPYYSNLLATSVHKRVEYSTF